MGFFNRFFGTSTAQEEQPQITFGRYSDSYKESTQYDAWDRSLECFEEEKYIEAYREFFTYLRDPKEDNVSFSKEDGKIQFELFQGSKKIHGVADAERIKIEARIAKADVLNLDFMHRLIEQNYSLKYSRFALDPEDNIVIKFDSFTLDGSPYKLYYALKEIATNADKQDDLLLDEFVMLHPVEIAHLKELPVAEKKVKYDFIIEEIQAVLEEVDHGKLDTKQYPGGMAYLFLHLSYKLDFLVRPEGFMMETLERVHRLYFANDGKNTFDKISILRDEFEKLKGRSQEDFFKEMYLVKSTFGITNPANHDRVVSFIEGELHNMDWYSENGYDKIALAVPGYIVGYCMFNYAVPAPDRAFFFLFYQITETRFFNALGFTSRYYNSDQQQFDKKAIKRAIRHIVSEHEMSYPDLYPNTNALNYTSLHDFAKSYLLMIRDLNLARMR